MKEVFTLLSIFLTLNQAPCFTQPVSEVLARATAEEFILSRAPAHELLGGALKITDINVCRKDNVDLYYIINYAQGGFILISADMRFYPVLAYSFEARFDPDDIPENCRSWLDLYEAQIKNALVHNGPFFRDMPLKWQPTEFIHSDLDSLSEVLPLVPSIWSQTYPFNRNCPEDPGGYDGYTPVGCVALAMAQLMYYYRFPFNGNGTEVYTPPYNGGIYGQQYADFSSAFYSWDRMTDVGHTARDSGAMICYHSGVALHTSYTPTSSGASVNNVSAALINHFNYLADDYLLRSDVDSARNWVSMLVDNLNKRQPVIYRSSAGFCGHVYLCDGYQDSTHFHFNWGWGGKYNGYYYIDNLVPGGIDLNASQGAVFNIFPDTTRFQYPGETGDTVLLTGSSGSFEDGSGPYDYLPGLHRSWLIQTDDPSITNLWLDFSMLNTESDADFIRIYDGNSSDFPLIATLSGNALPFSCKSSGPALFITFETDGQNQYNGFHGSYYGFSFPFCLTDQVLTDASGILLDGSGFLGYGNNSDCQWIIAPYISPLDSVAGVSLSFNRLNLASGDTVFIYDGVDKLSPLIGKISGNVLPDEIFSQSNAVLVNFVTDGADSASGWKISWRYYPPDYCTDTSIYQETEGIISDGSGDKNYSENTDCYYVIKIANTDFIRIDFSEFDLEQDYDYVKIIDPEYPSFYLYKFSGHSLPAGVSIPLQEVLLQFHTDDRDNYQGWKLMFSGYGSGTAEMEYPVIISPNPARDWLKIQFPLTITDGTQLTFYRMDGSSIYSAFYYSYPLTIDIRSWPPGIYFLLILNDEKVYGNQIIKL